MPELRKKQLAIDWHLSLQLVNNNLQLAEEMLAMFAKSLPQFQQDIANTHQNQDMKGLHMHVHKLHGGTCYVGAPKIKATTAEIETLLKTKKLTDLEPLITQLIDEITSFLIEYKEQSFRN